jgi:hypothetical protein
MAESGLRFEHLGGAETGVVNPSYDRNQGREIHQVAERVL